MKENKQISWENRLRIRKRASTSDLVFHTSQTTNDTFSVVYLKAQILHEDELIFPKS